MRRRNAFADLVEATKQLADALGRIAEMAWPDVIHTLANARGQIRSISSLLPRSDRGRGRPRARKPPRRKKT